MSNDKPDARKQDSLDLDFNDITSKTTKVKSIKEELEPLSQPSVREPVKKSKEVTLTGITIAIPTSARTRWIVKDIAECTSDEFLSWAKFSYPEVTAEATRFDSISNRIRAFDKIRVYHSSKMSEKERTAVN